MITLKNSSGMEVRAIPYGAIITSIRVPDRDGHFDDVVLGYDNAEAYVQNNSPFMGAVVGRYGNRIAKGTFILDGRTYTLAKNNGPNHLHGGIKGFDKVIWQPEEFKNSDGGGVIFRYTSADGEEGYPGKLTAQVTYTLTNRNELIVDYLATTDKPTVVNLTQHSYFNLTGAARDVLAHEVTINANRFTPTDATNIPTGILQPVEGTPFDFRQPHAIGARINDDNDQLQNGKGYDHNYVLNRSGEGLVRAAQVYDPSTGRILTVSTTEPGVQFYTGNNLDGSITGKGGHVYSKRFGFCLETQHFPDSPNEPQFPSTVLRPGSEFRSRTVFAFTVNVSRPQ
ncbi:MAG TPA: aldose epimerase family protein [Terriglobia bacterium]|nr:aldose epimerase family protein [Terriglobia bacterium]